MLGKDIKVGVVGSGAMGSGIAQVAATAGHKVTVYDTNAASLEKAETGLRSTLAKLVEKEKIPQEKSDLIFGNIVYTDVMEDLRDSGLIIEAIVENLAVKKEVFAKLEELTNENCVLATNTSSLSVTSIAAACKNPEKVIGIHFFNPAPLMPLVEIIPGIATEKALADEVKALILSWGKSPVICKDTPGFIVNRIARPFYGEAMRIEEEGIADIDSIDRIMRETGGFRMGPFELTDLIGHDVNYIVTETVWKEFYNDPRYRPSLSQKRLLEAGFLGRKSGRGYYNYSDAAPSEGSFDEATGKYVFERILCMLINEAADALYLKIGSREDIDTAMTKGVNYPKGLLKWADEIGIDRVFGILSGLQEEYGDDRYRPSVLLRKMAASGATFY
jgi:3-hydroxybutyryl-CoA dehydrogenase